MMSTQYMLSKTTFSKHQAKYLYANSSLDKYVAYRDGTRLIKIKSDCNIKGNL